MTLTDQLTDYVHAAVRQYLGLPPAEPQPHLVAHSEEA